MSGYWLYHGQAEMSLKVLVKIFPPPNGLKTALYFYLADKLISMKHLQLNLEKIILKCMCVCAVQLSTIDCNVMIILSDISKTPSTSFNVWG